MSENESRIPARVKEVVSEIKDLITAVGSADARRRLVFHGAEKAEKMGFVTHEELLRAKADFKFHERMRRIHNSKKHGLSKYQYEVAEGLLLPFYIGSK